MRIQNVKNFKFYSIKKENILIVVYLIVILTGVIVSANSEKTESVTASLPVNKKVVIIDAGHGGWDPGKISGDTSEILEKDINLDISKILQTYLEQAGATVIMTRTSDEALANEKNADLRERNKVALDSGGDIFISIHQNSYPSEQVKGAQVFYYNKSEEGFKLAENIQGKLKEFADTSNSRIASSNESYYILKQIQIPSVIVECGFLSNEEETIKLTTQDYQERIAWSIYMGILDYYSR